MTVAGSLFGTPAPINPRSGQAMSRAFLQADKTNREGAPAFSRPLEEDALAVLTTQTLGNTFYASKKELAQELVDVLRKVSDKDPLFLAQALVYARQNGLMKLAPTIGLAVLSENKTSAGREAFRKAFRQVIRIPDDLREFVTLIRTGAFGPKAMTGLRKTMIQNWLRHMSEYHGVKYGSTASEGMTLRDILRLTHPRPKDGKGTAGKDYDRLRSGAQAELFGWLVKGWEKVGLDPSPSNPMVWALERVKRWEGESAEAEIIKLVREYKLPWEVVVPSVKKMTTQIWKALMGTMPYMALLRNLNTFDRHGVLADKAAVQEIARRLSDRENVKKSKQLPFRFWNAFKVYTGPQEIRDALSDALEASFENMPELSGRICISNDTSGSMGSPASEKGTTTYAEIAGIFAAALFKKAPDVMLLPFDTEVHAEKGRVSRRDTILSIVQAISGHGGGTDIGAPIRHLLREKKQVDVFIGITDQEDWAGRGFLTEWEEYKRKLSPNAKAFLVTIAPYRDGLAPAGTRDVYFTYGWSDSVLRFISTVLSGGTGQVDHVRSIDLVTFGKKAETVEVEAE